MLWITSNGLLLDNNIFRTFCSSDEAYKNWFGDVRKHFKGDRFHVTVTPYTILEGVGIRVKRLNDAALSNDLRNVSEIENAKKMIFDCAMDFFSTMPELDRTNLLQEAGKRASFFSGGPKQFFVDVTTYALNDPGFMKRMYAYLAMDEVAKFPLPTHLLEKRFISAMVDIYRGHHHVENVSQYRAMQACWLSFMTNHVIPRFPNLKQKIQEFNDGILVGAKKDYLDTEIVSMSCGGYRIKGGAEKVYAFTCDKPDVVLRRCAVYSFYLTHTFDMVREGKVKYGGIIPFDLYRPVAGNIIFCRSDGHIVSMHGTKQLPKKMIPFMKLPSLLQDKGDS